MNAKSASQMATEKAGARPREAAPECVGMSGIARSIPHSVNGSHLSVSARENDGILISLPALNFK